MLIAILIALLAPQPPQNTLFVERGRAGPVSIGVVAENVYREFDARLIDLKLEGYLTPALEIRLPGSERTSLIAEIGASGDTLVVTRIRVLDPRLHTKEGIGIDSTYADLRSRYSIAWVAAGEQYFVARAEPLGISFMLDVSGQPGLRSIRDPTSVPDDVRIIGMFLTR
jgi:hypothetical protein